MTQHFTRSQGEYVEAASPDGTPVYFRPLVNIIKPADTGTVELTIGTTPLVVRGTAGDYLEFLDPSPVDPTPPVDDITHGALRINEDGTAIALELPEGDERGRWRVTVLISELGYYTTDADNPEIAGWPYLKVNTGD
ncbi:hypothetical protein [Mycobacteroides chelonae]|uniref:hypothetical protein n=1 Tax=Mycobacteroides chelonae TaxID=1774 RepID=UPI003876C9F2